MLYRRSKSTKFACHEWVVDKALRSPVFDNLEEIDGTFEIKEFKPTVTIKRPYQCCVAVFQLIKLQMLKFHYDFLDTYLNMQYFELCYVDTNLFCLAMIQDTLKEIVKLWSRQAYEADKIH